MIFIALYCTGHFRHIHITNTTVTKTFVVEEMRSIQWLGMNETQAFYHESEVYLQIEKKRKHCSLGSDNVVKLLNLNFNTLSITTELRGVPLTYHANIDSKHLNHTLQNISTFMKCVGVCHCDVVSKNFAITKSRNLYIFDMDMAYIIDRKPHRLRCKDTIEQSIHTFKYVTH